MLQEQAVDIASAFTVSCRWKHLIRESCKFRFRCHLDLTERRRALVLFLFVLVSRRRICLLRRNLFRRLLLLALVLQYLEDSVAITCVHTYAHLTRIHVQSLKALPVSLFIINMASYGPDSTAPLEDSHHVKSPSLNKSSQETRAKFRRRASKDDLSNSRSKRARSMYPRGDTRSAC